MSVALKFRHVSAKGSRGSSSAPSSNPANWSAAAAAAAASPRVRARNFAASRTRAAATSAKPNPRILGATSTTKAHVAQASAAVADARGTRAQALRACFEYLCGNQKFTARSARWRGDAGSSPLDTLVDFHTVEYASATAAVRPLAATDSVARAMPYSAAVR